MDFTAQQCDASLMAQQRAYYDTVAVPQLQAYLREVLAPVNETIYSLQYIFNSRRAPPQRGGGRAGCRKEGWSTSQLGLHAQLA